MTLNIMNSSNYDYLLCLFYVVSFESMLWYGTWPLITVVEETRPKNKSGFRENFACFIIYVQIIPGVERGYWENQT